VFARTSERVKSRTITRKEHFNAFQDEHQSRAHLPESWRQLERLSRSAGPKLLQKEMDHEDENENQGWRPRLFCNEFDTDKQAPSRKERLTRRRSGLEFSWRE